jgi:hypothetical protein
MQLRENEMNNANQVIEHQPKQVAAQPVTPAQMLQMAVEQGADLDKLTKLMDLQDRWEAAQSRKAYTVSMAKFREICPSIQKTRKAHNSQYAGLAETLAQIKPAMSSNGLSHTWKTNQEGAFISVTCIVTHIDGHIESTTLGAGADSSGSKNSIQAIGSTISYLERYTLFAILGLASGDQDDDGAAACSDLITESQQASIEALISEVGADRGRFLKYLKVADLSHIKLTQYGTAIAALEAKRK